MAEETVGFRTSATLLDLLGSQLYKRVTGPIVELAKNCLDADATKILFYFQLGRGAGPDRILVQDNGYGMDKKGVDSFYTIATSGKRGKQTTRSGRPMIGRYGVGNVGLNAIGGYHILETVCEERDGKVIRRVEVDFEKLKAMGVDWMTHRHEIGKSTDNRLHTGTSIEISQLRDDYARRKFGALKERLMKALGKELTGHLRFAEIRVDDVLVRSYMDELLRGVDPMEISFKVEDPDNEKTYTAKGKIFLLEQALQPGDSGVFPIIKGTNPNKDGHAYAQFASMPAAWGKLRDRVYGEVEAPFLEDLLDLSRDGFKGSDSSALLAAYHVALAQKLQELIPREEAIRRERKTQDEKELEALWAKTGSALYRGEQSLQSPVDQVRESERGRSAGEKLPPARDWGGEGGSGEGKGESAHPPHPRPHDLGHGKMSVRLGGTTVNIRHARLGDKDPLVGVSGGDSAFPEILVNKDHPLYSDAEQRGADTINDVVFPQIVEVMAAYRLSMEREHPTWEAVREVTEGKLKQWGEMRKST